MTILHATDFSKGADAALDEAARFAHLLRARVVLLHVLDEIVTIPGAPAGDPNGRDDAQESWARQEMATRVEGLRRAGVEVEGQVVPGRAVDRIVRTAEEERAELLVLGTHGRSGLRRMLLGSVAERVLRLVQCPVLTVREAGLAAGTTTIVVPVDLSPGSDAAAAYALGLAARIGARVRLVHAVVALGYAAAGGVPGMVDDVRRAGAAARAQIDRDLGALVERLGKTGGTTPVDGTVVEAGVSVPDAVVQAARDARADLVVMGTHGRTGIRRMLLGSVAEHVIRLADCPVLTVK